MAGGGGKLMFSMLPRMPSLTGIHFNNSFKVLSKVISYSYILLKNPFPTNILCSSAHKVHDLNEILKTKQLNLDLEIHSRGVPGRLSR